MQQRSVQVRIKRFNVFLANWTQSEEGGILVLTPQNGKATVALAQLRKSLVAQGASLEEMLTELRRKRESDGT